MTNAPELITSQTPTSPHLSRMARLAEQLVQTVEEMAYLFRDDTVVRDLTISGVSVATGSWSPAVSRSRRKVRCR
jgi:hypothetical protein